MDIINRGLWPGPGFILHTNNVHYTNVGCLCCLQVWFKNTYVTFPLLPEPTTRQEARLVGKGGKVDQLLAAFTKTTSTYTKLSVDLLFEETHTFMVWKLVVLYIIFVSYSFYAGDV